MKFNNLPLSLAAFTGLALTATSAHAAVINTSNAGFENSSTFIGNGNNTVIADWTEDAGNAYVDLGNGWTPEASATLYFGGGASVNQDLSHNWSSSDSLTVGIIAMNPAWSDNNNTFTVQLRQASDDTVLWDSGAQNVGGTVTGARNNTSYTGTGHIFSWNVDASTFTAGTAGEQINIRIAHVSGGPVYADKVSLDLNGPDVTAPTLASTVPEDEATGFSSSAHLVATFTEDIAITGTGNITIKNLTDATQILIPVGDAQVSVSGTDLVINPTADLLVNKSYAIQISAAAVEDLAANPFVGILDDTTWNFTTDVDTIDPVIASFSPADDAAGVSENNYLVATFSEPITPALSGNITLKNLSDLTETVIPVTDLRVLISGDSLTINPGMSLEFGDQYAVRIDAGAITDLSGNPFAGIGDDTIWNFRTRAMPTFIDISNAGFDDASGDASGGNYASPTNWIEENEGSVYVDGVDERTTWKPEADRVLYLGGDGAAVNRDLDHNWSSGDKYTLSLVGQEAGWRVGAAGDAFSVQLRQTDGTVLWESGSQNVDGTVAGSQGNFSYTGTGHLFSWIIDASTFTGVGVVEGSQLNLRIAQEGGVPYMDDVSIDLGGGSGGAFAITEIELGPNADFVTLTWRKTGAANYIAKVSSDMTGWDSDLNDDIDNEDDERPADAEHITLTFPLTGGLENELKLFFRIEEGQGN